MKKLIINAENISGMEQIHDRFYAAFDFPECYGENLDALYDCLCEVVTYDSEIRITNSSHLKERLGEKNADRLRRVLADASAENPHISVVFEE